MTEILDGPAELVDADRYDCRDAFAETLLALAKRDPRIVGVVNDSVGSSKLEQFLRRFPDRLIDVGIAEQDLVGVAAGLANGGRKPYVSAASCFLTARALEQIKVDVAYSDYDITLCGMSPGVAYGTLGPTHHSVEDIAWLRAIDHLGIIVPADPVETAAVLRWTATQRRPTFVRISRMPVPIVHAQDYTYDNDRALMMRDGTDLTIISNGTMLWRCLVAADRLGADGVQARVLSMPTIRPLDRRSIRRAARETGAILTVEESTTRGGLGGAVAEVLVESEPVPARLLGLNAFPATGTSEQLLDRAGLSIDGITRAADQLVRRIG